MQFTASQIAALINGKIEGDDKTFVSSFGKIENATNGELTFLANPKYEEHLYTTNASIIIINDVQEIKQSICATLIRVPDAYSAFATILATYKKMITEQLHGIQQPVFISTSAKIGENVYIGAFSYIGENVVIGDNVKIFPQVFLGDNAMIDEGTILYPGVKIYHECKIGKRVTVHANTIIGSDGFGFAPQKDGSFKKVPQIGNVVIEDDVEVGANATIDRATLGSTLIKTGAKLDNLIQIAHNVEVGNHTVIAAQAGISGSTKIGNNVMIGGQAGLVGHIQIADGVKIGAQSGVSKSIKVADSIVVGSPAIEYISSLRGLAIIPNLPELKKRIMELEQMVQQLMTEKISH
ncbi:MAG: UDP-3-O-(3-hydroxymyristoyl)glucosamine N-acyltransferase [Chitinophagaceae bacterium]